MYPIGVDVTCRFPVRWTISVFFFEKEYPSSYDPGEWAGKGVLIHGLHQIPLDQRLSDGHGQCYGRKAREYQTYFVESWRPQTMLIHESKCTFFFHTWSGFQFCEWTIQKGTHKSNHHFLRARFVRFVSFQESYRLHIFTQRGAFSGREDKLLTNAELRGRCRLWGRCEDFFLWKSCTTWDVKKPVNNGINYLSTGTGFLPSTVLFTKPLKWTMNT